MDVECWCAKSQEPRALLSSINFQSLSKISNHWHTINCLALMPRDKTTRRIICSTTLDCGFFSPLSSTRSRSRQHRFDIRWNFYRIAVDIHWVWVLEEFWDLMVTTNSSPIRLSSLYSISEEHDKRVDVTRIIEWYPRAVGNWWKGSWGCERTWIMNFIMEEPPVFGFKKAEVLLKISKLVFILLLSSFLILNFLFKFKFVLVTSKPKSLPTTS